MTQSPEHNQPDLNQTTGVACLAIASPSTQYSNPLPICELRQEWSWLSVGVSFDDGSPMSDYRSRCNLCHSFAEQKIFVNDQEKRNYRLKEVVKTAC